MNILKSLTLMLIASLFTHCLFDSGNGDDTNAAISSSAAQPVAVVSSSLLSDTTALSSSSETVVVSSEVNVSSNTTLSSSETIAVSSATTPSSSETIAVSSATTPSSSETIVVSSATTPSSSEVIAVSSAQLYHTITFQAPANGTLSVPSIEVIAGVPTDVTGITVTPSEGYLFNEWVAIAGECSINTITPLNITCSASSSITATFKKKEYTINVIKTGDCGTIGSNPYNYSVGADAVSLSITPGEYCTVSSVTSADLEITYDGTNYSVTGIKAGSFSPVGSAFLVTVAFESVPIPEVDIRFACYANGESVNCSAVNTSPLTNVIIKENDGVYTFTPSPKTGYTFTDITVDSNVTLTGNDIGYAAEGTAVVSVNYTREAYTLSVQSDGNGSISTTNASINHGEATDLSITTSSNSGYYFNKWVGYDGCVITDQSSPTVICTRDGGYIEAEFDIPVKYVSVGEHHTMILKSDGSLWATGMSYYGQLGGGIQSDKRTPIQVMTGVANVSTGSLHTMILKTDGSLWATGFNAYGQLGDGTQSEKSTPVQVMTGVADISASSNYTMILKIDGSLWATGRNNYGQLGDGTTTDKSTPIQVMTSVADVTSGRGYTMIIKTDGSLWATGHNAQGQLGDGSTSNKSTPIQVMTSVESISTGFYHTMILKSDESLWATGHNAQGQHCDGTQTSRNTPIQVMTSVADVSAGALYSMILKTDGSLWAAGYNSFGQLGDGSTEIKSPPVQVMTGVTAVSSGVSHTMIIKIDGSLWGTGKNSSGHLGDGTKVNRTTPVKVLF